LAIFERPGAWARRFSSQGFNVSAAARFLLPDTAFVSAAASDITFDLVALSSPARFQTSVATGAGADLDGAGQRSGRKPEGSDDL
jgi:hypothetical protein